MTQNQTKVRTETQNRDPEPCSVLFSERVAAVVEGNGATILQLNVEGLTNAKLSIIEQLTNKVTAILLQETHCETMEKLTILEFTPAAQILNKQHGLATFVRQDIEWSLEAQSEDDSQLEWLAVKVQDVTIINKYKPPPTHLTRASLPVVNLPGIYAGDFNCHHEWGYSRSNNDGTCLVEWASANNLTRLYNPKEPDSFHSARWNSGTNPDLASFC